MPGWGVGGWGVAPWGLGGGAVAVEPGQVSDEGGTILTLLGAFRPNLRATVTVVGTTVTCPCPRTLGGVDSTGGLAGSGIYPLASADGSTMRCVVPPLPVGLYSLSIHQPGFPALVAADALEVVRRDFSTRHYSLRAKYPTPPYPARAVGAKSLRLEPLSGPAVAGERVPVLAAHLTALGWALHEGGGVLLTRLVPPPWQAGSVLVAVSSAGGDVGQRVTVSGLDAAGEAIEETLVLNGLVPVVGALAFASVDLAVLDHPCVGTVTVADGAGTPPEAFAIRPGNLRLQSGAVQEGDTSLTVEGNLDFPDSGALALRGERVSYTAKVTSRFVNTFALGAGVSSSHSIYETVADLTGGQSILDQAREQVDAALAEGEHLVATGRRLGAYERIAGLDEETYRSLVRGSAFSPRGTRSALVRLLTELFGSPHPTIVEDPVCFTETVTPGGEVIRTGVPRGYPCTVWIDLAAGGVGGTSRMGRWFLGPGEAASSTDATHVSVTYPPVHVVGAYLATDRWRRGVNFANHDGTADAQLPGAPTPNQIDSLAGGFVAGDLGRHLILSGCARLASNGAWVVTAVLGPGSVEVAGKARPWGRVSAGTPTVFEVDPKVPYPACPFGPWHVGREIRVDVVVDDPGGLWGAVPVTRTILAVLDRRKVVVSAAWPGEGGEMTWRFMPAFTAEGPVDWGIPRATAAGNVVTLARPVAGPGVALLVDYLPGNGASGNLLLDLDDRNDPAGSCWPPYLYGGDAWLREVLSDFVPAGWRVRFGDPHA